MEDTVLIVEAEETTRAVLEIEIQRRLGFRTVTATNGPEALRLADEYPIRVCVVDLDLPDGRGYHLIPSLKKVRPGLHTIVISSDYSQEAERASRACGIVLYMTKPLDLALLEMALCTAWKNAVGPGPGPQPVFAAAEGFGIHATE